MPERIPEKWRCQTEAEGDHWIIKHNERMPLAFNPKSDPQNDSIGSKPKENHKGQLSPNCKNEANSLPEWIDLANKCVHLLFTLPPTNIAFVGG